MKNKEVFLYGASGHGKVVFDVVKSSGRKVVKIFDDNDSIKFFLGLKVSNFGVRLLNEDSLIISIGNNKIRKKIAQRFHHNTFTQAIHINSIIDDTVQVGSGTVIMAGAVINSSTIVGNHCIINTASSVDHDCYIKDFVHISPNATLCGGVTIGELSHIGAGCTILPEVSIGKNVIIGAGSVVLNNFPDDVVVAGNPAKIIKKNES